MRAIRCFSAGLVSAFLAVILRRAWRNAASLEASRELLEMVIDDLPAAVNIVRGRDLRILHVNPHYRSFAPEKAMVGRTMPDVWREVWPILDPIFSEVLRSGRAFSGQDIPYSIRRSSDGPLEEAYFSWSLSRFRLPNGEWGLLNTAWETTARKKIEDALKENERKYRELCERLHESAESLKTALNARDDFLSIASHELKTPLSSLKLQVQALRRGIQRGDASVYRPDRVQKLADQYERQIARLVRLVDDMLDVSRIQSGRLTIQPEAASLSEIVGEVVDRLKPQFPAGGAVEISERGDRIEGYWDRFRIEQVVTNLLTNALRYGHGRPVTIRLENHGAKAVISVRDQGYGISKEDQARIFNRFERAVSPNEVSGLGMGLFITEEIVKLHGGRIWVESELGKGSTFYAELPVMARVAKETA